MMTLNEADRAWLSQQIAERVEYATNVVDLVQARVELRERLVVAAVRALSRKAFDGWTADEIADEAVKIADATLKRMEAAEEERREGEPT